MLYIKRKNKRFSGGFPFSRIDPYQTLDRKTGFLGWIYHPIGICVYIRPIIKILAYSCPLSQSDQSSINHEHIQEETHP